MRLTGYHNPDNLEIYTVREAHQALSILTSSDDPLERLDISLNMVNTIQALENRLYGLEVGLKNVRSLLSPQNKDELR